MLKKYRSKWKSVAGKSVRELWYLRHRASSGIQVLSVRNAEVCGQMLRKMLRECVMTATMWSRRVFEVEVSKQEISDFMCSGIAVNYNINEVIRYAECKVKCSSHL